MHLPSRIPPYRARSVACCGLLLATATANPALASPLLETTGAALSSHPFTARALPSGPASTFFNPALIVGHPGAQFGTLVLSQQLDLHLVPRPHGVDVDESIYDARVPNPDGTTSRLPIRPLPTGALRERRGSADTDHTSMYLVGGMIVEAVPDTLAVGLYATVPTTSFQTQTSSFVDEREQYFSNSLHFERYGEDFDTSLIAIALGARPIDGMALGAGLTITTEGEADNEIFVPDASDQGAMHINTNVRVRTRLRPHLGVAIEPVDALTLTGTVHLPSRNDVVGSNDLQLWNFEYPAGQRSFTQTYAYRNQASPLRASVGAAFGASKSEGWAAGAVVTYARWSEYVNHHREAPLDAWLDTLAGSLGAAWRGESHGASVDLTYEPSPVPDQVGRTNYVDNDRVGSAIAYALTYAWAGIQFETGLHLQLHRLMPRSVRRSTRATHPVIDEFPTAVDGRTGEPIEASLGLQTNNPGFPGFSSEGWLFGAGMSLTARFERQGTTP